MCALFPSKFTVNIIVRSSPADWVVESELELGERWFRRSGSTISYNKWHPEVPFVKFHPTALNSFQRLSVLKSPQAFAMKGGLLSGLLWICIANNIGRPREFDKWPVILLSGPKVGDAKINNASLLPIRIWN